MSRAKADLTPKVRIARPGGLPVLLTIEAYMRSITEVVRQLGGSIEFEGAERATETPDGVRFKITPGGATDDHAWRCKSIDGDFTMLGGAYNGEEIAPTVLGDGSGWAYIVANWDLTFASGYLTVATLTSASVSTAAAVPADSPGSGTFHVPLVQFASRRVLSQAATRSISATVCHLSEDTAQHTILQS